MKNVLYAGGSTVNLAFQEATKMNDRQCAVTSAGNLSCKQIIFIPWKPDQTTGAIFEKSIREFVVTAIDNARGAGCLTLAFPALGKYIFVDGWYIFCFRVEHWRLYKHQTHLRCSVLFYKN